MREMLRKAIGESWGAFKNNLDLYAMYIGVLDPESGKLSESGEIDFANSQPKDAISYLLKLYPQAVELRQLTRLYLGAFDEGSYYDERCRGCKSLAESMISEAEGGIEQLSAAFFSRYGSLNRMGRT